MLPRGNRDAPGYAPLAAMHPLLYVGNELAASHAPAPGYFQSVVSTVPPLDAQLSRTPSLTTHRVYFLDEMGRESPAGEAYARSCILAGAEAVRAALALGKRTLVHCAYGQNRSTAICIAFAVLYQGWTAEEATAYVVRQNRLHRQYYGQHPCSNATFNRIVKELSDTHGRASGARLAGAPVAKKPRTSLLTSWLGIASLAAAPILRRHSMSAAGPVAAEGREASVLASSRSAGADAHADMPASGSLLPRGRSSLTVGRGMGA
ncbi:hypothetical protein KFE25_012519 [Diacronema lutheri]|uniref:Dual specificity phosphatase catalytic domain-containing protein n=1 Tax=Diacronema lutheri TaxID=2081491 RepID=A0A8J6CBJ1_DIALT|nr:hypothetical protein KFE25_012519 [Diacronema lutheri]